MIENKRKSHRGEILKRFTDGLLILGVGDHGRVVKEVAEVTGKMQETEEITHLPENEMSVADRELSEEYTRDFGTEISFF